MKKVAFVLAFLVLLLANLFPQSSSLLGDANEDGGVTIVDALVVAQYYVGITPARINLALCDVNADGTASIVDALLIAQYYVGIITQFPGQAQGVEILKSSAERNTQPVLNSGELAELVKGNTAFATDLYKSIAASTDNIIISPYSISVAMAMCYAGAKLSTDTEIANTMHFTLGQSRLHNAFNALAIELAKPGTTALPTDTGQQFTLKIANSVWGQKAYPFVQEFLDTLAINYGAGLNILDFITNPDACRVRINTWVSDNTEQKIKDLLPPGSINETARMVLTNAIYMKASWLSPFKPADTGPGTFTLLDGTTTTAQMMNKSFEMTGVEKSGEYQAVSIPYFGSKYTMVIILPAQGKFKTFEASLNADTLGSLFDSLGRKAVTLSMPKFSFEWGKSIKSLFQALGMTIPFSDAANFSGIATIETLCIGDVFHKAFIGVNEEGTEAAAATAVLIGVTSIPEPMTININRPFIFLITEKTTNTVLFAGRVLKL